MRTEPPSVSVERGTGDRERLELVRWLIDSYDQRKASVAGRAAILLSADALLIAATTLLIERIWSQDFGYSTAERSGLAAGAGLTLILLVISAAVATNGMANVWRTHWGRFGGNPPSRLFFYPRQTFKRFDAARGSGFEEFSQVLWTISEKDFAAEAMGLWVITGEYRERYRTLRQATRLFVAGIVPLVVAVVFVLYKSIH
jgi:hypothetical protein